MDDDGAAADLSTEPMPLAAIAELQDHLLTASNDLDRLQTLLADACDTLMQRFYGLSGEVRGLLADATDQPSAAAFDGLLGHLGGAVTALQFQDLASQLIHHTHRRLRSCADQLAQGAFGDDDEDGGTVMAELPERPNPVTQAEMDAGSIELF